MTFYLVFMEEKWDGTNFINVIEDNSVRFSEASVFTE